MNEREIFLAAIAIADAQARCSFLDSICKPGDPVRTRIDELLQAHSSPQNAIDRVAGYIARQVFDTSVGVSDRTENEALADLASHFLLRQAIGEDVHLSDGEPPKIGKPASIPPGTRLDRYEIVRRIGYGGMGEVYLARDTKLDRNVAIKLLKPQRITDAKWLQQFRREARSVGALNHPNILTIHEIGESGGIHFFVSELVDGVTLRQKIAENAVSIAEAIEYARQIASALVAAHAANIIHRDLKPENLMVRADGLIKVLDFGLAKQVAMQDQLQPKFDSTRYSSQPGIVIGTIHYMSPEQARGKSVDTRTDIFSLGVVLYEMLTRTLPFQGETSSDVLAAILEHEPRPIQQKCRNVSNEFANLIHKCLRKDPKKRYRTAGDILSDLKKILDPAAIVTSDANSKSENMPAAEQDLDQVPPVRYAHSRDVNIAYQTLGDGPIDLVFVMGWVSHLEMFWKEPSFAQFLKRLAKFSRLILFDKRGTGLSDKVPNDQLPTLEQRMDDVRAVMDAVGSERAVLCGVSEGGPMCTLFAATYPEKTIALAMIGSYARRLWAQDYPWGPTDEHREHFLEEMRRDWGGPVGIDDRAPSKADDLQFRNWWASYLRMGASPGAALALTQMNSQIDIRPILSSVQVPTLVIHRTDDRCLLVEEGRYLAENIPGAKFVELPGNDHLPFVGDQDSILDEIEEFLTGVRHSKFADRVLATVLYAVFISHPEESRRPEAVSKTDNLFQSHVVREVALFHGQNVSFRKNAVVVSFDGPARAVRAANAINETATRLGLCLRSGVHTGECDLFDKLISGPAVELAELVAAQAGESEVLVSNTVKDLVVGSGLNFEPRSTIELPNQSGKLSLFLTIR